MKVYGIPQSQPVRTLLWALAIHETPYQLVPTMPGRKKKGGTRHPDYLAKFPNATAVNEDGDVHVSECTAILRYLAAKHNWAEYYPSDPKTRAQIDFYLSWHHQNTRQLTMALFAPAIRADLGLEVDNTVAPRVLPMLERFLSSGTKFLTGDTPTLADLVVYGDVGQCQQKYCDLVDFSPYPRVQGWLARVETLPKHEEVHAPLAQLHPVFKRLKAKAKAKAKL
eukprot:CAMPEP_0206318292 /NCGR_PEP_ID=MMETSP0106_2-20121207/17102_1 /ASSEMBLY_ACC=CAM_ASM_000206 /TAXON_ID=81532 /ORGANISM="Acanthoeca-like sp., Strain 10tr" /LENGTH=223 /DNA_ID=CAMNT_0053749963 /DNA_START=91 /DNA_END=763 /DNA_ORIENTATION=+